MLTNVNRFLFFILTHTNGQLKFKRNIVKIVTSIALTRTLNKAPLFFCVLKSKVTLIQATVIFWRVNVVNVLKSKSNFYFFVNIYFVGGNIFCWKCPQKQSNVDTSNFYFFDKIQDGNPIIFIFESVQLLTHTNVQYKFQRNRITIVTCITFTSKCVGGRGPVRKP